MEGKKHVMSFDNYDTVVRMNGYGVLGGIFQCVVERRRSDYFAIGDE
jgi:hypothetical protein